MRYYVTSIEYNENTQAENRTQPKAYNTLDEAKKEFHHILSQNICGATIGWCNVILWDQYGNVLIRDYWQKPQSVSEESQG